MRWRPEFLLFSLTVLLLVAARPAFPQTPPAAPKAAAPTLPDYGGRESPAATVPADAERTLPSLNPAAQIGRALGALVLVLGLVVAVLFALKKFGLAPGVRPGISVPRAVKLPKAFAAPDSPIVLLGSQPLPGTPGAFVHLLTIADRTLLVGATAQQVTVLTEIAVTEEKRSEENEDATFEAYLQRQEMATPPALVIQTARTRVGQAADRISALAAESKSG